MLLFRHQSLVNYCREKPFNFSLCVAFIARWPQNEGKEKLFFDVKMRSKKRSFLCNFPIIISFLLLQLDLSFFGPTSAKESLSFSPLRFFKCKKAYLLSLESPSKKCFASVFPTFGSESHTVS